jgi:hypothetical protein
MSSHGGIWVYTLIEALKIEQHEHFELRAAIGLVCDALTVIQVCLGASSLWSHLGVTF